MKTYNIIFYELGKPGLALRDFYLRFKSINDAITFATMNKGLNEGYRIRED